MRLPRSFFNRNTCQVARDLVGCQLIYEHEDCDLSGIVVETEAYTEGDPACHGWNLLDEATGEINQESRGYGLFEEPGTAYIYLIYGMYWMLNVVTEEKGKGGGVLIRAVEPTGGLDEMQNRRSAAKKDIDLTNGPGKLTQAFDINEELHGTSLLAPPLYFARPDANGMPLNIATSSRIGISKGVDRQWRYFLVDNPYVSPGTPSDEIH